MNPKSTLIGNINNTNVIKTLPTFKYTDTYEYFT